MEGVSGKISSLAVAEPATFPMEAALRAARLNGRDAPQPAEDVVSMFHPDGSPSGCVWQSHVGGESVGILGLIHVGRHVVRLSPFRIDPQWQHTAALTRLLQRAHEYCWNHSCLKVLVEEGSVPQWLHHLLDRHGFHMARRRQAAGRYVLEFYLDLYHGPVGLTPSSRAK